jgi:hypothetical protein
MLPQRCLSPRINPSPQAKKLRPPQDIRWHVPSDVVRLPQGRQPKPDSFSTFTACQLPLVLVDLSAHHCGYVLSSSTPRTQLRLEHVFPELIEQLRAPSVAK